MDCIFLGDCSIKWSVKSEKADLSELSAIIQIHLKPHTVQLLINLHMVSCTALLALLASLSINKRCNQGCQVCVYSIMNLESKIDHALRLGGEYSSSSVNHSDTSQLCKSVRSCMQKRVDR